MPAGEAGEHFSESGGYSDSSGGGFNQGGGGFQSGGGRDMGYPGYSTYGSAGQAPGWQGPGTVSQNSTGTNSPTMQQLMQRIMTQTIYNPILKKYVPYPQPKPGIPSVYDPLSSIVAPQWINDPTGIFSYPKNNQGMENWNDYVGGGKYQDRITPDPTGGKYQDRVPGSNPGGSGPGFGGNQIDSGPMNMMQLAPGGPQVMPPQTMPPQVMPPQTMPPQPQQRMTPQLWAQLMARRRQSQQWPRSAGLMLRHRYNRPLAA